jgi:16S rRNA (uracil1498-N3)-methyltransferase
VLEDAKRDGISRIAVFVGSEGGFSPEEAAAAQEAGAISVSLGSRILRCETAPLFAVSCIAYTYEL